MLAFLVSSSIRARGAVLAALAMLLLAGGYSAATLPVDAMPDVSTTQVAVLTTANGLSPLEVELSVTLPIENLLNGLPGSTELRSTSRAGLSAVVVVFSDAVDPWFARALTLERLRGVENLLPPGTDTPELGPLSTGLGEIYQFVVRSPQHTPMQLRTMLDWEIVPRLRSVPGIIEINTMGGELKQYQVRVDPERLRAHRLTLTQVVEKLRGAHRNAGGGYIERDAESYVVRGQGMLRDEQEIGQVVLATDEKGTPILVRQVADVKVGAALRHGVITHNGKGEAVTGIVMMVLGANSHTVIRAVHDRMEEIRRELAPGVEIDVVYDRADFVNATIGTVLKNLLEGVLIVTLVLFLFLGTLRGALAVVLGIPASMSVALLGMHLFHVTGDLMSLGAIDFGFLVDGPIVMLEGVITATAGRTLLGKQRLREYLGITSHAARPVAFAVAIIMLVYLPLLTLEGVEGKMFRPMALTMACALAGGLIYAVFFFPAVLAVLVPPKADHGPRWMEWLAHQYARVAPFTVRQRVPLLVMASALLVGSTWLFASQGAEFVPRIFEGDAMVTIRRAPSVSLPEARRLDLMVENVLHTFPEILTSLGMTGRAEVAIDPVGNDNTDVLIRLRPMKEWKTALDFDGLSEAIKNAVETQVPGTFTSVSQPIEDKTNELISGSRADVAVQLYGPGLEELAQLADRVGDRVRRIPGAGDVRIERIMGQPIINAVANRQTMARHGVSVEDAFMVLQASREGVPTGSLYEGQKRFDMRVLQPPRENTAEALGELFVETTAGISVPLSEVVTLAETDGPTSIRRLDRQRVVRIDVNLRGRDLVSFVEEARQVIAREFPLPAGYRVEYGGQFENFARAQKRLAVVIPGVVIIILGMLLWMFRNLRFALPVFLMVPFSLSGGMLGLLARGMPFSLPAAVGFIALGGIAVLNGVVIATEVRALMHKGTALGVALEQGASNVVRAVLTTAAVAALGFLPMALATSAGAEVQQPLATVVIVGILFGTLLTLLVLPGMLSFFLTGYVSERDVRVEEAEDPPVELVPAHL